MATTIEVYGDSGNLLMSDTFPMLALAEKRYINATPQVYPGNNPGQNWRYVDLSFSAEAPMVAFIGDPYSFYPQVTDMGGNQFAVRLWTNTPVNLTGWMYVFDRPNASNERYVTVWDEQGRVTFSLGSKPMRIHGVAQILPDGTVGAEMAEFPPGRVMAAVQAVPATSTFATAFTVTGIRSGGKQGLFGQAISIPKIGPGGSPNQAVIGHVIAVDVTHY